jgi:hypothetical protein
MPDPHLLGEIARLPGGGQGAAEPTDQIERAASEGEETVRRPLGVDTAPRTGVGGGFRRSG